MKGSSSQSPSFYLPEPLLRELLQSLNVITSADTNKEIIAYCPFHDNRDSPAFNISKTGPHPWKCHNGKCGKAGKTLITLLTLKGYSRTEAERIVVKGGYEISDLSALVETLMAEPKEEAKEEWNGIDPQKFKSADEDSGFPVQQYMSGRGITLPAYDYFGMGYSKGKHMAVIPVFDTYGKLSGVIGREIETKRYQYSSGLGRGELVWNLHHAKRFDSIILCEGSLDAIYLWQSGFSNVGAVLGSTISPRQWRELRHHFTEVVCFFDNDEAGQSLTESTIESIRDIAISYVVYPDRMVTFVDRDGNERERPVKDPGELTQDEIREMIQNRKSGLGLLFNTE